MSLIRFGEFSADPRTQELLRDGRRVRLPRQSFQILMALTRAPGELVTRETLQAQLWPATSQVEWEQGLNAAINRLREALGDSAAEPKYIETLPRRGYRFIGRLEPAPATPVPAAAVLTTARRPRRWPIIAGASTIVAAAVLAFALWRLPAPPVAQLTVVPLTTFTGEERAPSFSPDGTRIVFAANGEDADGRFDLYVKSLDSERLLRLTRAPSIGLSPAWSPDGNSIAFVRQLPDRDGVFIVPALGGPERRVAPAVLADPPFLQVAWSPDGKTLAYSTYDGASHVIRFVDVRTLGLYSLPQAPECWHTGLPAYSADGKRLAFVCTTSVGVYSVFISPLDGGVPQRLATVMGEPRGLAWDADQSHLILANDAGDGGALWRLAADGSLTRLPFGEEGSAPARVAGKLAYVRGRQAVEIWRMELTAPDPAVSAQRLIASTRVETTPQYSPDGQLIAFQSSRSGSTEVWLAGATGGDPVRLTHFNGPMTGAPRWCGDGKRVVLDSRAAGQAGLYVVDVEERQPRRIDGDVQLSLPEWSSDCTKIIASDGRARLFILPATGGAPEPFTGQPSYFAQVTGDRVIFNVKQVERVALWQKPIAGGEEGALPGMPLLDYTDAWAVADAGVYFTTDDAAPGDSGPAILHFYGFADRKVRRLVELPKAPAPGGGLGLAVSRDGRWVLYTQSGAAESDIMIAASEL